MNRLRFLSLTGLLGFAAFMLSACASLGMNYEKPKVAVTSIKMKEPQGLSQRFGIGLNISNPNAVALPIKGMSYALRVNGYELVQGVTNNIGELAAFGETKVELDAATDLVSALRLANDFLKGGNSQETRYTFEAKISVSGLPRPLVVEQTGVVPFLGQGESLKLQ